MSATHYETLGVEQGVEPDEIRKAYRRAASAAHPDREGGSDEAMQRVNKAFEVLSDTERRAAYDAAGCTEEPDGLAPVHVEARELLRKLFTEALDRSGTTVLKHVRSQLTDLLIHVQANRRELGPRRKLLEKRRNAVRTKDGAENLVHAIVDGELRDLERNAARFDRMERIHTLAVATLDAYEEDAAEPVAPVWGARFDVSGVPGW